MWEWCYLSGEGEGKRGRWRVEVADIFYFVSEEIQLEMPLGIGRSGKVITRQK